MLYEQYQPPTSTTDTRHPGQEQVNQQRHAPTQESPPASRTPRSGGKWDANGDGGSAGLAIGLSKMKRGDAFLKIALWCSGAGPGSLTLKLFGGYGSSFSGAASMLMFQESLAETTREVLPPCRCVAVSSGGNNNRNHGAERRTQALHPGRVTKRKVARRGDKVGEVGEGGRRGIGPGNPDWSVTAPFPSLPQREQPGIGTRSDARAQTDSCRRGKTEAEMVRCPGVVWDGWLWLLLTGGHRDGTPGQ